MLVWLSMALLFLAVLCLFQCLAALLTSHMTSVCVPAGIWSGGTRRLVWRRRLPSSTCLLLCLYDKYMVSEGWRHMMMMMMMNPLNPSMFSFCFWCWQFWEFFDSVSVFCPDLLTCRCSTWRDWRRNHHQRLERGVLSMAAQPWNVPLQNGRSQPGKEDLDWRESLVETNGADEDDREPEENILIF